MCVAKLANTTMVPKSNANGHEITGQAKSMQDAAVSAKPTGTDTPLTQQAGPLNMPLVRKTLTLKTYPHQNHYGLVAPRYRQTIPLLSWERFCAQKAIVVKDASTENGIDFTRMA